jgi:bla regulator protein blaR1
VLNHLWQSTVFAGLAWVVTLTLKKNWAQVRYAVWLAASAKFLVPMALLVAAGSSVSWRTAPPPSVRTVIEEVARPFGATEAPAVNRAVRTRVDFLPKLLWLVWGCGFVTVMFRWGRKWTRMRANVRRARPMDLGLPIPVRESAELFEPGVFGAFRPVLLLPEGITEKLTPAQLQAILAHELCHVRRRDNLATALHMTVEAVFWFHPLVWWIGARLVEERERACDEEVIGAGNDPQTYAEGILKVCEFYLKSPLEFVAGVAGGNLNRRIEEIMTHAIKPGLNAGRKLMLVGAGALTVIGPLAIGLMNAPPIRAQASAGRWTFEVASVRPHQAGDRNYALPVFHPGGRFTFGAPLVYLIEGAYNISLNQLRLTGGPDWINALDSAYDIEATAPKGVIHDGLSANARAERERGMLQALLADRLKLMIRRETKEMPIYALVAAQGGPKLQKADIDEKDCQEDSVIRIANPDGSVGCHQIGGGQGRGLHARAADMADLASYMEGWTDRPLVDRTGIKGLYRLETSPWLPMKLGVNPPAAGAKQDGFDMADLPTIYGVFERMGLKMEPQKGRVDVYVIEHVEKPSDN